MDQKIFILISVENSNSKTRSNKVKNYKFERQIYELM